MQENIKYPNINHIILQLPDVEVTLLNTVKILSNHNKKQLFPPDWPCSIFSTQDLLTEMMSHDALPFFLWVLSNDLTEL
jgi:hypothetical protein